MKPCHERSRGNPLLRFTALYTTLLLLCLLALSVTGCDGRQPASSPAAQGLVQREALPLAAAPAPQQPAARQSYRNVPVLGELDRAEFDRTMLAMTAWVAPQSGCSHCHVDGDDASDAKPAKATARRMLQMVQHINNNWKPHVGSAGVTCQTCHQGEPRPAALAGEAVAGAAQAGVAQRVATAGTRMLTDINGHFMAGGTPAACSSCHAAGGSSVLARSEPARQDPARNYPALTLLPTETAAAPIVAVRAGNDTCAQAAGAAVKAGARLTLAQGQRPVVGDGALPLFSAPDAGCAMMELHLQASDTVEAFVVHAGYTSVRYRRAATGSEARGWVRNERLGPALPVTALVAPAATRPAGLQSAVAAGPVPAGCSWPVEQAAAHETLRGRARVLGQGRLQFFAVPDAGCPLRGIFILPGEPVETLQRAPGFIAVAYVNPRTGGRATGWVTAARVGMTGDAQATLLR
jgi:hypothetical protein